jgi:hypothetical protein
MRIPGVYRTVAINQNGKSLENLGRALGQDALTDEERQAVARLARNR